MKLHEIKDWKAVHFNDRTLLRTDGLYIPSILWDSLLHDFEVTPMKAKGHYKVIGKINWENNN
jgi:hypothetical protein